MDIKDVLKILNGEEVQNSCDIKDIADIKFEKGFEDDEILITFLEKLDFDYEKYDINNMTKGQKFQMELEYSIAKEIRKVQSIIVSKDILED